MASADKVPMLEEGHRKLNEELRRLKNERPEIVEAIEAARAHGDLSENAEYHAAKERQGQIEATIADLEDRLSRAMVIDPKSLSGDKVVFGATVTLTDEDDKPPLPSRRPDRVSPSYSSVIITGLTAVSRTGPIRGITQPRSTSA